MTDQPARALVQGVDAAVDPSAAGRRDAIRERLPASVEAGRVRSTVRRSARRRTRRPVNPSRATVR